jgi:hypothetical protein
MGASAKKGDEGENTKPEEREHNMEMLAPASNFAEARQKKIDKQNGEGSETRQRRLRTWEKSAANQLCRIVLLWLRIHAAPGIRIK